MDDPRTPAPHPMHPDASATGDGGPFGSGRRPAGDARLVPSLFGPREFAGGRVRVYGCSPGCLLLSLLVSIVASVLLTLLLNAVL